MKALVVTLGFLWLALAGAATIATLRSNSYPRQKRPLMIFLAWLVPIAGALLVFYFITRPKSAAYPQASSDTMAIDVLAAGSIESAARPDDDRH
jgi:hypothetical protein